MENFHTLDKIDYYKEAKLIEREIADEQKKKEDRVQFNWNKLAMKYFMTRYYWRYENDHTWRYSLMRKPFLERE